MGQKVNPHGFRVSPTKNKGWDVIFYAEKSDYLNWTLQNLRSQETIKKLSGKAYVSRVVSENPSAGKKIVFQVYANKPGVLLNSKVKLNNGTEILNIERIKKEVQKIYPDKEVYFNVHEVKNSFLEASIVAQMIVEQLEKGIAYKKVMKNANQSVMKAGAKGVKIICAGRLAGAEIARTEWYQLGRVPMHEIRANIKYAKAEAKTSYGIIGVKVYINSPEA